MPNVCFRGSQIFQIFQRNWAPADMAGHNVMILCDEPTNMFMQGERAQRVKRNWAPTDMAGHHVTIYR